MSVGTEITRLQNAKTAIASAIAGKGINVPSGTLISGMAALIDAIEQSAFPGEVVTHLYVGTVVPTKYMNIYSDKLTITHALGVIPDCVMLIRAMAGKPSSSGERTSHVLFPKISETQYAAVVSYYTTDTTYAPMSSGVWKGNTTMATTETAEISGFSESNYLKPGNTYLAIAMKFA